MTCKDLDLAMLQSALEMVKEMDKLNQYTLMNSREPEAEDDLKKSESRHETSIHNKVKTVQRKHLPTDDIGKKNPEWW